MIQMEFTEEEYRKLCEVVYVADWVATSLKADAHETSPYHSLDQKILGRAAAARCGDLVDYDSELKTFFPSPELDEKCEPVIREFESDLFWEELTNRMAERDIKQGGECLSEGDANLEKRFDALDKKEEYYNQEFSQHGIERLTIAKP
ncbi:MAG: hypothetical protein JNK54_07855 [Elusimicrobia bacterium]|jgi:hypothetical protein|nr:hypothetical protein [Elusimicrobiota bacterium]